MLKMQLIDALQRETVLSKRLDDLLVLSVGHGGVQKAGTGADTHFYALRMALSSKNSLAT